MCRKYSKWIIIQAEDKGSWWGVGVRGLTGEHDEVLPQNDDDLVAWEFRQQVRPKI